MVFITGYLEFGIPGVVTTAVMKGSIPAVTILVHSLEWSYSRRRAILILYRIPWSGSMPEG
jgi:hypothetical protein